MDQCLKFLVQPLRCSPFNSPQKPLGKHYQSPKTPQHYLLPCHLNGISVRELKMKKADFQPVAYDCRSIPFFLTYFPPQCWIWDTKEPPWKSDFIGRLQHHPKGTEIPATTPWLQQLLDQTLNTVVAALTPLKMLTTAFTDQHLLPGYQCKSTLILDFPNN